MTLMEGITILSTAEKNIYAPGWNVGAVIFLILGVICVCTVVVSICSAEQPDLFALGIIGLLICVIFGALNYSSGSIIGTYNTYQVIIDDSVSLVEFNERYEIISQDGLIYTIRELEK